MKLSDIKDNEMYAPIVLRTILKSATVDFEGRKVRLKYSKSTLFNLEKRGIIDKPKHRMLRGRNTGKDRLYLGIEIKKIFEQVKEYVIKQQTQWKKETD